MIALAVASAAEVAQAADKLPIKVPKAGSIIKRVSKTAGKSMGLSGGSLALFSIGIILLIALGFFLWKRRKDKAKPAEVSEDAQGGTIPTVDPITAGQLRKVWRGFLGGLQPVFRRSIGNFQPFVVLGPAGSGKSATISTYTDWERQAKQFLASETDNPDLQVYLGSNSVVLELPAKFLHDTSPMARSALMNLFRPILRRRSPVVVVPISLPVLHTMSPEAVRSLADTIRGKINTVAAARGKMASEGPIEVRIVLTHVDSIDGFETFSGFAEHQQVPLRFLIDPANETDSMHDQVADGVASFGKYLPLALTKLSSPKYKEVVGFLKEAPQHFDTLEVFVGALFAHESLNARPHAGPVYLACSSPIGAISNPFHVSSDELRTAGARPVRMHLIGASALGAVAATYFLLGFLMERPLWEEATGKIRGHESVVFDADTRRSVRAFSRRHDTVLSVFPSFYASAQDDIDRRLSNNLRDHLLIPRLEESMHDELWPHRKALYHLAVIHASRGTKLGSLARGLAKGPLGDELGTGTIAEYVDATAEKYPTKLSLEVLRQRDKVRLAFSPEPWMNFLRRVEAIIDRDYIDQTELAGLQAAAAEHLASIETIHRYERSHKILKELPEYKEDYERHLADLNSPEVSGQLLAPMTALLEYIVSTAPVGQPAQLHLPRFSDQLRTLLGSKDSRRTFTIRVPRRGQEGELSTTDVVEFNLERTDWAALIRASRVRNLVRSFVTQRRPRANATFFPEEVSLRSFSLQPTVPGPSGAAIFTGSAVLDGQYTKMAYDIHVRPALEDFLEVAELLSGALPPAELANLKDHVGQEVDLFAQRYRHSVDKFYAAYGVNAGSSDALAVTFAQLARPTSALTHFLDIVHGNTHLAFDTENAELAQLLEPLARALRHYKPIHGVMLSDAGGPRELDTYIAIVEQIRSRVVASVERPPPDPGEVGLAGNLADQLYPVGQMALESVIGQQDNVSVLVGAWLAKMQVKGDLARPFRLPLQQLLRVGTRQLQRVVEEVWHYEVLRNLDPMMRKFPFDRHAADEVTAEELERAFHPKHGLVFDRYRRFFQPISREDGGAYSSRRQGIALPTKMFPLLNKIATLTNTLWDETGAPRPIKMNVRSIPFDATRDMRSVMTLVYVKFGTASVFNFNQQPFTKSLEMDWTAPQTSQVGVQLTNVRSGQQRYPMSLVTRESYFSHLHLLLGAETTDGGPRETYQEIDREIMREKRWHVPYGDDKSRHAIVRFFVGGDPLEIFDFAELTREDEKRFASLSMGAR